MKDFARRHRRAILGWYIAAMVTISLFLQILDLRGAI